MKSDIYPVGIEYLIGTVGHLENVSASISWAFQDFLAQSYNLDNWQ